MSKIIDNYILVEKIGFGSSSEVFKAKHLEREEVVAIKVIKLDSFMGQSNLREALVNEIQLMKKSKFPDCHPKVIKMLKSSNHIYLVFELLTGKALNEIIKSSSYSMTDIPIFINNILESVQKIHESGIIHNGLKPKAIFIDENCKFLNFKFHKKINVDESNSNDEKSIYSSKDREVSEKSDVYSIGVLMISLIAKKVLDDDCDLKLTLNNLHLDDSLNEFISFMICKDPTQRPSIKEISKFLQDLTMSPKSKTEPLQENKNLMNISNGSQENYSNTNTKDNSFFDLEKIIQTRKEINHLFPFLQMVCQMKLLPNNLLKNLEILFSRFLFSTQELNIQNLKNMKLSNPSIPDSFINALIHEHREFNKNQEKNLYDMTSNKNIIIEIKDYCTKIILNENYENDVILQVYGISNAIYRNSIYEIKNLLKPSHSNLETLRSELLI